MQMSAFADRTTQSGLHYGHSKRRNALLKGDIVSRPRHPEKMLSASPESIGRSLQIRLKMIVGVDLFCSLASVQSK